MKVLLILEDMRKELNNIDRSGLLTPIKRRSTQNETGITLDRMI